ncbi:MAG TPA: tRNA preQ1(34) S-adenosylmethionine ribosyltransferase-isomerase QueA [Pyrinomonadaceae bacterium]|nr:tRNA preQ1(34) S-adenosylmethionine ribosyltransferase-isomerase QueA [Pyrinomonadaceae bacterium]
MQISDFDFYLPNELIASEPLQNRSDSRLLFVDRVGSSFNDAAFADLPGLLRPHDLLVLNNTKVFPARLFGKTATGGKVEIFLVKQIDGNLWKTLAKPARRLRVGSTINFSEELSCVVEEKFSDGSLALSFVSSADLETLIDRLGRTPLPPYIRRASGGPDTDRERYQTVYASRRGAIAAPTAGLHFTPEMIEQVRDRGVEISEITLHVGYGTFEPVRSHDLSSHRVAPEQFEIGESAAAKLERARREMRRIVAVGTTTTRALEYVLSRYGCFKAMSEYADLTITPGYRFRAIGAMLTNFHLPQSSLLILVSTFAGHELIMKAYTHAVKARYRFYSYGDCMFIE